MLVALLSSYLAPQLYSDRCQHFVKGAILVLKLFPLYFRLIAICIWSKSAIWFSRSPRYRFRWLFAISHSHFFIVLNVLTTIQFFFVAIRWFAVARNGLLTLPSFTTISYLLSVMNCWFEDWVQLYPWSHWPLWQSYEYYWNSIYEVDYWKNTSWQLVLYERGKKP